MFLVPRRKICRGADLRIVSAGSNNRLEVEVATGRSSSVDLYLFMVGTQWSFEILIRRDRQDIIQDSDKKYGPLSTASYVIPHFAKRWTDSGAGTSFTGVPFPD